MAKLVNSETGQEVEVKDGDSIIKAAEQLGVIFACQDGMCTSCQTEVVEGIGNLTERTDNEKEFSMKPSERLACQCKIKKGVVKIRVY